MPAPDQIDPTDDQASQPSAAVDAEAVQTAVEAAVPETEPSGPKRVAVVVAHPDDAEFICAGTIARWTAEGHHVTYVLLTSGDKGSDDPTVTGDQLVAVREAEQRAACDVLGVQDVLFLRYPDAIYPAARDRMTFPDLLAEGLAPHKVQEVYLAGAKDPDVWIDITDHLDTKLAALRAHASQIADWDPEPMLRDWAREAANGRDGAGEYAESFKYFKLG